LHTEEVRMAQKVERENVRRPRPQKIFKVRKAAPGEQEILLHFGRPVHYDVIKLSSTGLPGRTRDGKKIHWINNWKIKDLKGRVVGKVRYTVFVRAPKKRVGFVSYDRRGLHPVQTPRYRGSKRPRAGFVQIDFTTGDPAIGET
jgi:hypothetical protein